MAKINFFLKGTKEPKKVYYRYRPSKDFDLNGATPFEIDSQHWDKNNQCWNEMEIVKGAKLAEVKMKNKEIDTFNNNIAQFSINLSDHISKKTHLKSGELKESIREFVQQNYFGYKIKEEKSKKIIPESIVKLIDYYLQIRSTSDPTQGLEALTKNTKDSYISLKNKLIEYDKYLKVTEIDNNFRAKFVNWLNNEKKCSASYQSKFLKQIKGLCKFAESEYEIKKEVFNWKIINEPDTVGENISFTNKQIKILEELDLSENEKLDNARDWLVISCYCALRVSDLLELNANNIEYDKDTEDYFYSFTEIKTKKEHSIWLFPTVVKILEKRKGKFPKKISSQKYNEYIKEVCKKANFTNKIEGAKRIKVVIDNKSEQRLVKGEYPFYELVTSHIGRRTFATVFQNMGAGILRKQTGHSSDKFIKAYITTSKKELRKKDSAEFAKAVKKSGILEEK